MTRRSRPAAVGVLDQVASSGSNALMVFALARVSSVDQFGTLSIVLAIVIAGLGCSRGIFGTPVALAATSREQLEAETSRAVVGAAVLGLAAAAAALLVPASGATRGTIVVLAASAPFMYVQDTLRFYAFARFRQRLALLSDGLWFVIAAAVYTVCVVGPGPAPATVALCWAGAAVLALLVLGIGAGVRPTLHGVPAWFRASWDARLRYGLDALISSLTALALVLVVAALVGPTGNAAMRGAATFLGPLNVLLSMAVLAVVPTLRRQGLGDRTAWEVMGRLRRTALLMSLASLSLTVVALVVPPAWGALVLGDTWTHARPVLAVFGIEYMAQAWLVGTATANKVVENSRAVLRQRVMLSGLALAGAVVAALATGDVVAVAVASAAAAWLTAVVQTLRMRRAARPARAETSLG